MKEKAVNSLISCAKSELDFNQLRVDLNDYLNEFCNHPNLEYRIAHRVLAVQGLLIYCIYALNKEQLDKAQSAALLISKEYD